MNECKKKGVQKAKRVELGLGEARRARPTRTDGALG